MSQSVYGTSTMLPVVECMKKPPRFFLDMFYPDRILFDTESVAWDRLGHECRLAPLVQRCVEADMTANRFEETRVVTPAHVKDLTDLCCGIGLERVAGERIGGDGRSAALREEARLAQALADMQTRIGNRWEWLAVQAAVYGKVTLTGPKYPTTTIDFRRPAAHSYALSGSNVWGTVSGSNVTVNASALPLETIEEAAELAAACGVVPRHVIMGANAYKAFRKNPDIIARRLHSDGSAQFSYGEDRDSPARFRAEAEGYEIWTYSGDYCEPVYDSGTGHVVLDPSTNKPKFNRVPYFPVNHILVIGDIAGVRAYGAVPDQEARLVKAEWVPSDMKTFNPKAHLLMGESAPLMIPRRPEASVLIQVLEEAP